MGKSDDKKPESPKLFTKEDVAHALDVTMQVTLDRVWEALQERSYGVHKGITDDGDPIVQPVIDLKAAAKIINKMRGKPDPDEEAPTDE